MARGCNVMNSVRESNQDAYKICVRYERDEGRSSDLYVVVEHSIFDVAHFFSMEDWFSSVVVVQREMQAHTYKKGAQASCV